MHTIKEATIIAFHWFLVNQSIIKSTSAAIKGNQQSGLSNNFVVTTTTIMQRLFYRE